MITDSYRDSYALALAWLDQDDERAGEILARYDLGADGLGLLVSVLALVGVGRDAEELGELLFQLALCGAGRP